MKVHGEDKYKPLFETLAQGVVYQAADGTIIAANPAADGFLELTFDQIQGRISMNPRWEAIHEDGSFFPCDDHPAMVALRTGKDIRDVVIGVRIPGNNDHRWINVSAIPQMTPGATQPDHVYTIFQDISERRRSEQELQRRFYYLSILHSAGVLFSERLQLKEVGKRILDSLEQVLSWQRGSVWIIDERTRQLELLAHSEMGMTEQDLQAELQRVRGLVTGLGVGISGWVAANGIAIRSGNVRSDPHYVEAEPTMQSELCVPLRVGGRVIGSLNVESDKPDAFDERDEILLTTLASQAAIAVENARLFENLKRELDERKLLNQQLQHLSGHLQSAREEERKLVAREIHDELGQELTVIKMILSALQKKIAKDDGIVVPDVVERLKSLLDLSDRAIRTVRRIATELRPDVLDKLGLLDALRWLANGFQERTDIEIRIFHSNVEDLRLSDAVSTTVFRICQEALTNVARHSGASRVSIEFSAAEGMAQCAIHDNGCGMTEEERTSFGSLGLLGIRERAYLINGDVQFTNNSDGGTSLVVRFPI